LAIITITNYIQRVCVHNIYSLLFVLFFLFLTGCEDKKTDSTPIAMENTTEIFTPKDKKMQQEKRKRFQEQNKVPANVSKDNTFTLIDTQEITHTLTVVDKYISFHTINEPVIVLNFFSLNCSVCLDQMTSLSTLQKKYQNKIFVISVLRGDSKGNAQFLKLIQEHHITHFISNSKDDEEFSEKLYTALQISTSSKLPLTVIYKEGKYYNHFEGPIPIEMIHHDIQQSIKK